MASFEIGETVICSITVRDSTGSLQDAATTMSIVIDKIAPSYESVLASTGMTNDDTGLYHYDFASASKTAGNYRVTYVAVDGTRTTKHTDTFILVTAG